MRSLNLILMLLGALSVLMLGVLPAAAMTGSATPPPCHEATSRPGTQHDAPDPAGKAMAAMACCISCVVTPALQPTTRELAHAPEAPALPVPVNLPVGLSPAPEPGPPKA